MHRFFIPPEWITPEGVQLKDETARQISQVLRLRSEQRIVVLDNRGMEYELELLEVGAREARARVVEQRLCGAEPRTALTMFLGLTQREKFEWMLQKCTEIGAAQFVPVISSRSIVQDAHDADKKLERWRSIVREAAEQSHRGRIPTVQPAVSFAQALKMSGADSLALMAWEGEHALGLREALRQRGERGVALFIGPEGGYSSDEAAAAAQAGVQPVTLGARVLRMETAAVVAAALAMYELGEMDAA